MNDTPTGEQRKFHRIHFSANCRLAMGDREWACHLIDISLKGVLLDVPGYSAAHAGDRGKLTMRLDNGDTVIHMNIKVAHQSGFRLGARCELIDSDSMMHLRRLVELNLADEALLQRELAQLVE